ncbi:OLC1v1018263C1 [Oldenlandia corymbosa var. corymbosa]|uniref:OLC1v1018263C1 n=1 Tax=Oldenlandia corymbosa var. corymbosa TaxID=529605 RepID=A0AAV1EBI7_OLDCO|nr:OLC1v1018263C1 [Oldenlandia corymbosa var. corymbosa]
MGCRQRDFMFCEMCGTMLSFNSPVKVTCSVCSHQKLIKDIGPAEIRYTLTAEDIRRELGVSALEVFEEEKELKQIVSVVCVMYFHKLNSGL